MCVLEAGEPEADECAKHRKMLVGGYCQVERGGVFEAFAKVTRATCRLRRSAVADILFDEVRLREVLCQCFPRQAPVPQHSSLGGERWRNVLALHA
jgi:hypothetical protein